MVGVDTHPPSITRAPARLGRRERDAGGTRRDAAGALTPGQPLQPQPHPLGQLQEEPCPHEQPRMTIASFLPLTSPTVITLLHSGKTPEGDNLPLARTGS
jgi:hypothetical protein